MYELLKRLFETGLIEYSNSEWASAIVLVIKKNEPKYVCASATGLGEPADDADELPPTTNRRTD
ncbi:hypothetical protein PHMEG_0002394 [Phytophthora megakarya]|uniref:Reverse transcriptase n=1 Tax=Phytophthora megakarya TaxID=4795 RepID=A0A225X0W6_9STRA|nr:hypothetical protein PHMEG_0002394 [Phytophthora megakarya]